MRQRSLMAILGLGAILALAACGGDGSDSAASTADDSATLTTREVSDVGTVLTDSTGNTLYFADEEADGTIRCVDSCAEIWLPLTAPAGAQPNGDSAVTGRVGTVNRPDGTAQVTYDGKPLYTFAPDRGAGRATGNGLKDSFGGTSFVWHAATVTGAADAPAASGAPAPGGGYGY